MMRRNLSEGSDESPRDVQQLEATERRMVELQESTQGSWIDVQFLKAANEMVIELSLIHI